MIEIYNEELRDLLAPLNSKLKKQQSLQIKVRPCLYLSSFCVCVWVLLFALFAVFCCW